MDTEGDRGLYTLWYSNVGCRLQGGSDRDGQPRVRLEGGDAGVLTIEKRFKARDKKSAAGSWRRIR